MDLDERLTRKVLDALLQYVGHVKNEVLGFTRSVEEYPVRCEDARAHLCATFKAEARAHDSADGAATGIAAPIPQLVDSVLLSPTWNSTRIARKRYRNADGTSFAFFLPGDVHYAEPPKTRKEYLELLFALERRIRSSPGSSGAQGELTPERLDQDVRTAYYRLLSRARGAAYVSIPALRREVRADRADLDAGLLRMRDRGEAILSRHGFAAGLSPNDSADSLQVSPGEDFYYLTLRDTP